MTDYVCTQLSQPDNNGIQYCQSWVMQQSVIPDLTPDNVSQLTAAFAFFIATVAIFKLLRRAM